MLEDWRLIISGPISEWVLRRRMPVTPSLTRCPVGPFGQRSTYRKRNRPPARDRQRNIEQWIVGLWHFRTSAHQVVFRSSPVPQVPAHQASNVRPLLLRHRPINIKNTFSRVPFRLISGTRHTSAAVRSSGFLLLRHRHIRGSVRGFPDRPVLAHQASVRLAPALPVLATVGSELRSLPAAASSGPGVFR